MIKWTKTETREGATQTSAKLRQLTMMVLQGPYGFTMTLHHPHGVILGSVHPGPLEAAQGEISRLSASWLTQELEGLQTPVEAVPLGPMSCGCPTCD